MTIGETAQIDLIAAKPSEAEVKSIVVDHLDWSDPHGHAVLLQEKINAYLAFVEAGELPRATSVALPPSPRIVICVAALHAPPPEAAEFLARVAAFLDAEGMRFELDLSHAGAELR